MDITRLHTISEAQIADLLGLMRELTAETKVTSEMLRRTVETPGTHLFAAVDNVGRIAPTGYKGAVEDVVVAQTHRGQGLGRKLLEAIIDFAGNELGDVDLHLTSRPQRVAANALYQSLGFERRETNFYRLKIRRGRDKAIVSSYA